MLERFSGAARWVACAAVVAGLVAAASPAMADRGRDRARKPKYREDRAAREHVYRERRVNRHPRGTVHSHRSVYVKPLLVRRYEPIRHRYMPFPFWCHEPRVVYLHDRPFFFHASLGIFVSGASIFVDVGSVPPAGYRYYDPYCRISFGSLVEYRRHCGGRRHQPLVQLIAIESHDHDGCRHDEGYCCGYRHGGDHDGGDYDDGYYEDAYYGD